jgi:hypothetical protein
MEIIRNVLRDIKPEYWVALGAAVSILALLVAGFRHHTCEVTFALCVAHPAGRALPVGTSDGDVMSRWWREK